MDVPYVNQLDNAPRGNDCGPACVAMLTGSVNPALATAETVTDLSKRFDVAQDGTTARDLVRMGEYLGVELVADTAAPFPCISLVDYKALPRRYQVNGDFAHWIVRLSDTVYHDPLYRGDRGANIVTTKAVLDVAEQAARRAALEARMGEADAALDAHRRRLAGVVAALERATRMPAAALLLGCLLYTSDAADD